MANRSDSKSSNTNREDVSQGPPGHQATSNKVGSDKRLTEETQKLSAEERKRLLNPKEAEAGGPADIAVCGEEDPGSALELLVEEEEEKKKK